MTASPRLFALLVAGVAAAGPLSIMLWSGFDGLYGQDAYAYYGYAVGPLRDSLETLSLPPPFFWPLGYPISVALASYIAGAAPVAGQLVALGCAAAVAALTMLFAAELQREHDERTRTAPRAAIFAGLFAALTGQLWQSGMVVMSDTAALAAGTASMLLLARFARQGRRRLLIAGALCWGVAIAIRWAYALLFVPWLIAIWTMSTPLASRVRSTAVAAAMVALLLAPQMAIATVHQTGGTAESPAFAGNLAIYRWNPLNFVRRTFQTTDGELRYRWPNGVYYAVAPAHPAYFTPLGAAFALAGLLCLVRERSSRPLLIAGSWALVIYAFHAGAAWQNFRFTLAYLPPLALFAGVGADRLLRALAGSRTWIGRAALAATLVVMGAAAIRTCIMFVERAAEDVGIVRWAEAQLPADAVLVTFQLTPAFQHRSAREVRELYYETPASLAALAAGRRPLYLLIDTASAETQWRSLPPGINLRGLREHPGIAAIGRRAAYTLFRVGP